MKIEDLKSAGYNPRTISKKALAGLEKSIERFGLVQPIVWNQKTKTVVGGHQRIKALEARGETMVEVLVVSLSKKEEKALNVTLNSQAITGEFTKDIDALLDELKADVPDIHDDLLLEELRVGKLAEIEEDDIPAPPKKAITKPGDLWLLGDHRLLCGDSTKAEDVKRVMGRKKVGLCFTSPPYAQQRDYTKQIGDWDVLMRRVFENVQLADDGQLLVNLGLVHRGGECVQYWSGWIDWMRSNQWRFFGWYVWDQGFGLPGDWGGRLAPSFEFVFHFNKQSKKPEKWFNKDRRNIKRLQKGDSTFRGSDGKLKAFTNVECSTQLTKIPDSVIRVTRQCGPIGEGMSHPAVFSVQLAGFILRTWPFDVFDPFSGSGTTLIAAEQLNRRCYAIEIEPKYCDVAVKRWENLTGKKAKLKKR